MAIFFVTIDEDSPALGRKIAELYPDEHYVALEDRQWLINADKLTGALTDDLGIREGRRGARALVIRTETVAGWHRKSLWEWMRLKEAVK
jgi:hypothetical protein